MANGIRVPEGTRIVDRYTNVPGIYRNRRSGMYFCEMADGNHGLYLRAEFRVDTNAERNGAKVGDTVYRGLSTAQWEILAFYDDGTVHLRSRTGTREERNGVDKLADLYVRAVKRETLQQPKIRYSPEATRAGARA